jgi:hypothetical protein
MDFILNFFGSELGQTFIEIALVALTGGTGAAIVAFKKLVTAEKLTKGIIAGVNQFKSEDTPFDHQQLRRDIIQKVDDKLLTKLQKSGFDSS